MTMPFEPNANKELNITTDYGEFVRFPVKTHVVMKEDDLFEITGRYAGEFLQEDDMLFISEKIVAITQGRAFPISEIKPGRWARFLVKFVHKSPYGIGLGMPETMELAIREVGLLKILFAAICSAVCKLFGKRGVFYQICGDKARAIDGPCDYTIPPYNGYAKLAPDNPDKIAAELSGSLGCPIVVIDANDIGVEILGRSSPDISVDMCRQIFADNPLGQSDQQTPMAIVRRV
ncbi:MAG: coenzyme F420-0:L-glutamate ligase [Oscillospiraceae bacterium]|nr:coenzyme F420-0:L-glutamate ligase [Oscillospiraceae bacterium]